MHICFLCSEYPPARHGGIGTFTHLMAHALVQRGHAVTVVGTYAALARDVDEHDGGVHVLRLAQRGGSGLGVLRDARRLQRALDTIDAALPIDVLEGPEMAFAWISGAGRAVRVIRLHGGHHFFAAEEKRPLRPMRAWAERRSLARADALCAVSHHVARETARQVSLGDRPVEILHNFVDTERFAPRYDAEETGHVLFAGTICEKKGVRELLAAFPRVLAEVPSARLTLAGRDSPDHVTGASYTELMRRSLSTETAARITFAGAVPHAQMPELLARAAVCVFPSHAESLGIAWIEAMAMARACVVSATGPGPEVVEPGVSGLHVDPASPDAIADALVRLLRDDALRTRLGTAARSRVMAQYSAQVMVPLNEAFYAACLARHHGAR